MSTKSDILKQQDTQDAVPVEAKTPVPHGNGGTGGNGTQTPPPTPSPVNDGSAVTGKPADNSAGTVTAPVQQPTNNGGVTQQPATSTVAAPGVESPQKKMSYVELFQQLSPYKPPTQEELEKERKKEKREKIFAAIGDGIAALSNLYFTTQGAPNAYDPKNSMSAKVKERYDKLKKERDDNSRYYLSAYMQAMKNDEEGARDDRNWRHQLEREGVADDRYNKDIAHRDAREKVEDDRYAANIAHRDAREKVEDAHWDKNFEMQDKHFKESVRQFNVTSAQNQQRISMESKRLAREVQKDNVTFALGTGKGTISVPTNALNASNVSYVFSKLPSDVQSQCQGEAIYDSKKRKVVGYKKPTTEAMLICIGANIEGSADAQNALREISGQKPKVTKTIGLK